MGVPTPSGGLAHVTQHWHWATEWPYQDMRIRNIVCEGLWDDVIVGTRSMVARLGGGSSPLGSGGQERARGGQEYT